MRAGLIVFVAACSFEPGVLLRDAAVDSVTPPIDELVPPDAPPRVTQGLIALYTFDENGGSAVTDTAGVGAPVNLTISDVTKVAWSPGSLEITAPPIIASPMSVPNRINVTCKASNAMTLEVWASSSSASQSGAAGQFARTVTMSNNAGSRNFALGQMGTQWAMQARTANLSTDGQGSPILLGGTVQEATPTHLVLIVDTTRRALYVNGQQVATDALGGTLGIWMNGYRLGFGAEPSASNPWLGTLDLVAFYDRVLGNDEITNNYLAGAAAR